MEDKLVRALNIIEEEGNIFTKGDEYVIPLYQRAYAWADEQIKQLIEDVIDIESGIEVEYIDVEAEELTEIPEDDN